jgi:hypothetical protein
MTRLSRGLGVAAACSLVAVASIGAATGATSKPKPRSKPVLPLIRLNQKAPDVLVLTAPGYRLTLDKQDGEILDLVDRRNGVRLLRGENGCLWAAKQSTGVTTSGCSFDRTGDDRITHQWSPATSTLTLDYAGRSGSAGIDATVTITARATSFDMRLTLTSGVDYPLSAVLFPADLLANATRVDSGYMPTFLPGTRFLKGFFETSHQNVDTYPSRWVFADFMAADFGPSHLAMYSVNPSPSPIAPVDLGFIRNDAPAKCSDQTFCETHVFQTWVPNGETWSSPPVRIRVGGTIQDSLLAFRQDNGIGAYPSVADKVGSRLDALVRGPLIKADLWKGLPGFGDWAPYLRMLPSPALVHPVAFEQGGFDSHYPDFLPPDANWGTTADMEGVAVYARSLGQLVMPYLNVSWWNMQAPSINDLPPPLEPRDISMQTVRGAAVTEQFGDKDGYIVSPAAAPVRTRVVALMDEWSTEVQADCLFFDQIGARPWRRDFNPASPTPLAYYDGWLSLFAPYKNRCLMAEDGWDRLAESFSGFHGGLLQMSRQFQWPSTHWGDGNWQPYPIADWLFHDKVLLYQHDLYEPSMTTDPEVLTFNLAFGFLLSFAWDGQTGSIDSPWLELDGKVQRTVAPYYAGKRLTAFRTLSPDVTESVFDGGLSVVANWSATQSADVGGSTIAPLGFLARLADGTVLAATYGSSWSGVTFPSGSR